jgi:hypothetical protein
MSDRQTGNIKCSGNLQDNLEYLSEFMGTFPWMTPFDDLVIAASLILVNVSD